MLTIDDKRRSVSIYARVGTRILVARRKADLSQETFAKKVGISRQYLSKIENGQADICLNTLYSIAMALGKSLSELLEGVG